MSDYQLDEVGQLIGNKQTLEDELAQSKLQIKELELEVKRARNQTKSMVEAVCRKDRTITYLMSEGGRLADKAVLWDAILELGREDDGIYLGDALDRVQLVD